MNTKRLLKLADFLDELPREKFDFGQITYQGGKPMAEALKAGKTACGTVGCAIGWMPACFPRGLKWRTPQYSWGEASSPDVVLKGDSSIRDFEAAAMWFNLDADEASVLFTPNESGFGLRAISESASPKTVARRIRRFVEKNAGRRA